MSDVECRIRRGIFMHVLDSDTHCMKMRSSIDHLLFPEATVQPQTEDARAAFMPLLDRTRLRDLVTEYALAVSDLCADIAPIGVLEARDLARSSKHVRDPDLIDLSERQRTDMVRRLLTARREPPSTFLDLARWSSSRDCSSRGPARTRGRRAGRCSVESG